MSEITLTMDVCRDLLKKFVEAGFKTTSAASIKDGAALHRYFRILKGEEPESKEDPRSIYSSIFKTIEVFNSQCAYTLDDAAVIDKLITFVTSELSKTPENQISSQDEEKVVEI
jgi:hypothetical protein